MPGSALKIRAEKRKEEVQAGDVQVMEASRYGILLDTGNAKEGIVESDSQVLA